MKKLLTKQKMFIVILIAAIVGLISWQIINFNVENFDIVSKNPVSFGHNNISSISSWVRKFMIPSFPKGSNHPL